MIVLRFAYAMLDHDTKRERLIVKAVYKQAAIVSAAISITCNREGRIQRSCDCNNFTSLLLVEERNLNDVADVCKIEIADKTGVSMW